MKYLFLFIALFGFSIAFCQDIIIKDTINSVIFGNLDFDFMVGRNSQLSDKQNRSYNVSSSQKLDSSVIYRKNNDSNLWFASTTYSYDYFSNGLVAKKQERYFDENANQWIFINMTEYKFDSEKKLTQSNQNIWNGNNWQLQFKNEYFYSEKGLLIQYLQSWQADNELKIPNRYAYLYDELDRIIQVRYSEWDTFLNVWVEFSTINFVYAEDQTSLTVTTQIWDIANNKWSFTEKKQYLYNELGNNTETYYYYWDASKNAWVNIFKIKSEFDSFKNLISQITVDANGNPFGTFKKEINYNSEINLSEIYLPYNFMTDESLISNKMPLLQKTFVANDSSNNWIEESRVEYFISEFAVNINTTIEDGTIAIYPNPASNVVTVETGIQEYPLTLEIIDMGGRLLLTTQICNKTNIELSDLIDGYYTYRVTGKGKFKHGKLLIVK